MIIDLVTERNIQKFISLINLPYRPVTPSMYWQDSRRQNYEYYLNYRYSRVHLSQCFTQPQSDNELLRKGISSWTLRYFSGIPQRVFRLRRGIVISCSPPADSGAELWLFLHFRQKAFLESLCHLK